MYRVIIIGAGPAGAYLAYLLSRAGLRVLVLEKERFPRYKPCGGGITPKVVNLLDFDLGYVIEDRINTIVFSHRLTRPVSFTSEKPFTYMVSRDRFDALLADMAKKAGADILEGYRADRVEVTGKQVAVHSNGTVWQSNILVGADGAHSFVARSLGLAGEKKTAAALEAEIPLPAGKLQYYRSMIKIDYGIVPAGYAWIFPKSDHLSVGIWSTSPRQKRLKRLLEIFLHSEGLSEPASRVKTQGWIIPVNHKLKNLHKGRAMLLGDAAGLADAFTGEGIFPALYSARLAAEVIAAQDARPLPDLGQYAELVRKKIGPELASAFRLTRWVSPITGFIHGVLHRRQDLVRNFIEVASGDLSYTRFVQYFSQHMKTALRI